MTDTTRNRNTRTEAEARELWCPMVRYVMTDDPPANRWWDQEQAAKNPEQCRCIAGECAMWRWYRRDDDGQHYGCCGLAGDP